MSGSIASKIEALQLSWVLFTEEPDLRALRWRLGRQEEIATEAFLLQESREEGACSPDFFHEFYTPFDKAERFGFELVQSLFLEVQKEEPTNESGEAFAEWAIPSPFATESDIAYFWRAIISFISHFSLSRFFVAAFMPSSVEDEAAYVLWIQRAMYACPESARLLLIDTEETPIYDEFCAGKEPSLRSEIPDLEMPQALIDAQRKPSAVLTPGEKYRDCFLCMSERLGAADFAKAEELAAEALNIAGAQAWYFLIPPVQIAMASVLAGKGEHLKAIPRYLAAEQAAIIGEKSGPEEYRENCQQLLLPTGFGVGAGYVNAGLWEEAAAQYQRLVPVAVSQQKLDSQLDCHRMASLSFEMLKRYDEAWAEATLGLQIGEQMSPEQIQQSTFAYLGLALERLSQTGSRSAAWPQLERVIVRCLQTADWRPDGGVKP